MYIHVMHTCSSQTMLGISMFFYHLHMYTVPDPPIIEKVVPVYLGDNQMLQGIQTQLQLNSVRIIYMVYVHI